MKLLSKPDSTREFARVAQRYNEKRTLKHKFDNNKENHSEFDLKKANVRNSRLP